MSDHKPKPTYFFFVDGTKFETDKVTVTGLDIKTIAVVDASYQLFLEETGNAPDRQISDPDSLILSEHPPKHLYAVPPATFGQR